MPKVFLASWSGEKIEWLGLQAYGPAAVSGRRLSLNWR
jgi:hypothetical protein